MDKIEKSLLLFIKSALLNQKQYVQLNKEECEAVFKIALEHQVQVLVFEGMHLCGIESEVLSLFEQQIFFSVLHNQQQLYCIEQLKNEFSKENINFAFLKGTVLKHIYPKPEYRIMGDIDCLIDCGKYDKVKSVMLKLGYKEGKETDHELLWIKSPHINIELHKRLIPSYNYDYNEYYGDSWSFFYAGENKNEFRMKTEDEFIYLFTHLTKHYRDGGIGLRHFIDLYVYLNCFKEINYVYIEKELKRLQLLEFYKNVINTLNYWFEDQKPSGKQLLISDRVFMGGAYGDRKETDIAKAVRYSKEASNIFTTRIKYIWNLIFMPYSQMKKKYPILQDKAYLLPVFWAVRWFEAIFLKRNNISTEAKKIALINSNDIERYERDLKTVGLKFYDKEIFRQNKKNK